MATVSQPILVSIVPQRHAFLRQIIATYRALITEAKKARELHDMRVQLSRLTDRQLDDIGLRRDQIKTMRPDWLHTLAKN